MRTMAKIPKSRWYPLTRTTGQGILNGHTFTLCRLETSRMTHKLITRPIRVMAIANSVSLVTGQAYDPSSAARPQAEVRCKPMFAGRA